MESLSNQSGRKARANTPQAPCRGGSDARPSLADQASPFVESLSNQSGRKARANAPPSLADQASLFLVSLSNQSGRKARANAPQSQHLVEAGLRPAFSRRMRQPGRQDSTGVGQRAQGSAAELRYLDAWKMRNIYV